MNPLFPCLLFGAIATGLSACVTVSDDRDDLKAAFHDQVRACYILPRRAAGAEPVVLEVRLKPDGALERRPTVVSGSPDSLVARGALRALAACTPFAIPPGLASRYGAWKVMHIRFDT